MIEQGSGIALGHLLAEGPTAAPAAERSVIMGSALAFFIATVLFTASKGSPTIAILAADFALCGLLVFLSGTHRLRWLFLTHPILLFICSEFFHYPFTELGDGIAYRAVLSTYFDTASGTFDWDSGIFQNDFLSLFKFASFGILPVYFIPDFMFDSPQAEHVYLWQGTFHIGLVGLAMALGRRWNVFEERHLVPMALFAAIGPSFFDLGSVPTRHIVTFFSVLLFFISYLALLQSVTVPRVIGMVAAVFLILVSKAPLMLPALLFVLVDLALIGGRISRFRFILIAVAASFVFFYLGSFLISSTQGYLGGVAKEGAGTLGFLSTFPIAGPFFKLIFALVSPFPWSKADYHVEFVYGGNWPLFIAHMGSSLLGVYFFLALILRWSAWVRHPDIHVRQMLIFGAVMSSSIIGGSIGFHAYLLIYFPFFMPLLYERELRIHPFIPFAFVGLLEVITTASVSGAA